VPVDLIPPGGLRAMSIACSLGASRALVFGGSLPRSRAALMSLPDGRPITDYQFDSGYGGGGSPDLHWLAASSPVNGWNTEVVDLTSGIVQAQLTGYFGSFTPDSRFLVGNDGQGVASVIDWRTKNEVWSGPGHAAVMADSDPSTNKMLLWLSTGWTQAGTDTYDYWIVDPSGSSLRFNPRDCVSIVVSPARLCSFR
jgi:hypothetical protein